MAKQCVFKLLALKSKNGASMAVSVPGQPPPSWSILVFITFSHNNLNAKSKGGNKQTGQRDCKWYFRATYVDDVLKFHIFPCISDRELHFLCSRYVATHSPPPRAREPPLHLLTEQSEEPHNLMTSDGKKLSRRVEEGSEEDVLSFFCKGHCTEGCCLGNWGVS